MNKRGFTIIELLMVMAIIGVLSTFGVFSYNSVRKTARDTKRKSELRQYQNAVEVYGVKHDNTYPVYSGAISEGNLCNTSNLNLPSCPKDPQTPSKDYVYQGVASSYVLWAELEKQEVIGSTNYFVICSNGQNGIALDADMPPALGVCPTLQQ